MYLKSIYLRNFRLYEEAYFLFQPGVNQICGPNAKGKTTLLEAIYLLISGRSFRDATWSELIRHGADAFQLHATFVTQGIEQILRIHADRYERKIYCNSTLLPSTTSLLGTLKGGVFTPDDVALIKGAPALRRQFLDMQLAQSDPLYVHHTTRFHRAMRQRNSLLKAKNSAGLAVWEQEMALSADYICRQRMLAVEHLSKTGSPLYHQFTEGTFPLTFSYKTFYQNGDLAHFLLECFCKNRKREMELGFTLVGPHRDDLLIGIAGADSRIFASEGQQRLAAATLRLAEWEFVRANTAEKPLMLLDDIGISLDEERKEKLLGYTMQLGQVMITSTTVLSKTVSNTIQINQ